MGAKHGREAAELASAHYELLHVGSTTDERRVLERVREWRATRGAAGI
jgi:hypothetical protein